MYSKEEKIRRLKSLTRTEMEVVYYFCQGLNDDEICAKLNGITPKALNSRRTGIYKVLGIDAPDKEKQNYLAQEYCFLIPELVPSENVLNRWRPVKSKTSEENQNISNEIEKGKPSRFLLTLGIGFSCLLLVIVGYGGYLLGQGPFQVPLVNSPTLTDTPESPSESQQNTDTPLPSLTDITSTDTLLPTPTSTNTLVPTDTFIPPTEFIPPADGILFQDDFESGDLSAWTQYGGQWIVANGKLTMLADEVDAYEWIGLERPEWKNYVLSLAITLPHQNSAAQMEVAVAVRNEGSQPAYFGVSVNSVRSNVYWAFIEGGERTEIAGRNDGFAFDSGSTMQLEVQNETYTLKVNGREIQKITIGGYDSGGISLGTYCYIEGSCPLFDNVKITYLP